jgi:hypothetical protein
LVVSPIHPPLGDIKVLSNSHHARRTHATKAASSTLTPPQHLHRTRPDAVENTTTPPPTRVSQPLAPPPWQRPSSKDEEKTGKLPSTVANRGWPWPAPASHRRLERLTARRHHLRPLRPPTQPELTPALPVGRSHQPQPASTEPSPPEVEPTALPFTSTPPHSHGRPHCAGHQIRAGAARIRGHPPPPL